LATVLGHSIRWREWILDWPSCVLLVHGSANYGARKNNAAAREAVRYM
jgi:hypothetical protein